MNFLGSIKSMNFIDQINYQVIVAVWPVCIDWTTNKNKQTKNKSWG